MTNDQSVANIFTDIHAFLVDYVKLLETVNDSSGGGDANMLTIKLAEGVFPLPATFNRLSQRADELANRLRSQRRVLAQKRRHDISKGIDEENDTDNTTTGSFAFERGFRSHLDRLQNKITNKTLRTMLRYAQVILDSFELYDEMKSTKYSLNITFRLLPIVENIQKQLCCMSRSIQHKLDENASFIKEHLSKLQETLLAFEKDMRGKFDQYMSRDIRPPVLVIPCPPNKSSRNVYATVKSNNAFVDEDESDRGLVQITDVSSEDSLFSEETDTVPYR